MPAVAPQEGHRVADHRAENAVDTQSDRSRAPWQGRDHAAAMHAADGP